MAASSSITVRIDRKTLDRLERLSRATARSRSFLAAEAVRSFVDQNEWQVAAIKKGIRSADEGDFVEGDVVEAWLESWGMAGEKGKPR